MGYWDSYGAAYDRSYSAGNALGDMLKQHQAREQNQQVAQALQAGDYNKAGAAFAQAGDVENVQRVRQMQAAQAADQQKQAKEYLVNATAALLQVPADQRKEQYAASIRPALAQFGMPQELLTQIDNADMSDQSLSAFAAALGATSQREKLEFQKAGNDVLALDPYTGRKVAQYAGTTDPLEREIKEERLFALRNKADDLPPALMKAEEKDIEAVETSSVIQDQLQTALGQIESGALNLGPVANLVSTARNNLGQSDENSRNFGSFRAMLEKLRNDSLRLNAGVQTDGDAQRAWNELITNLNDEKLVAQRLKEIIALNERAVRFRQQNIERRRAGTGGQAQAATGEYTREQLLAEARRRGIM